MLLVLFKLNSHSDTLYNDKCNRKYAHEQSCWKNNVAHMLHLVLQFWTWRNVFSVHLGVKNMFCVRAVEVFLDTSTSAQASRGMVFFHIIEMFGLSGWHSTRSTTFMCLNCVSQQVEIWYHDFKKEEERNNPEEFEVGDLFMLCSAEGIRRGISSLLFIFICLCFFLLWYLFP